MSSFLRSAELLRSSKSGDFESVSRLLEDKSVNPNTANTDGETPIIMAARHGHQDIFKSLVSRGADVTKKDSNGWSTLLWAAHCGRIEMVRALLERDDVEVDDTSNNGATALMWAAKSNHVDVVKSLLRKGSDPFRQDQHGSTAIMYACYEGHARVVDLLLEQYKTKEDLDGGNHNQTTPLMWACKNGRLDIASCLIHRGAGVNCTDADGETALMRAVRGGHQDIVDLLIKNHADIKAQCSKGISALMLASVHGHHHILTTLMENGADVNALDAEGFSALMLASQQGHITVVKTLLTYGADLTTQNNAGLSAVDLATRRGHADVEEMLRTITYDQNVAIGRQLMYDNVIQPPPQLVPVPREYPMEYITFCTTNFHKVRRKGEGSFGVVYYAQDPKDEAVEFVVKRSKIDMLSDSELKSLRETFEKEIRLLTKCRHSNIVRLYGHCINQRAGKEQLCLLYEYCEHGDLSNILAKELTRKNLPAYRRVQIMYEISRAVNFLHNGGVSEGKSKYSFFHRDIKSSNICLTSDYTAKLIDCGLSKFVIDPDRANDPGSKSMGKTFFTQTLTIAGTPGYICPYYAQGHAFEAKCDVYSLGVVMLELITGISQEQIESSDRSFSSESLVQYFGRNQKKLVQDVDPLVAQGFKNKLVDLIRLTMSCVEPFPTGRPTMEDIVKQLSLIMDAMAGITSDIDLSEGELPTIVEAVPVSPGNTAMNNTSADMDNFQCGFCTQTVNARHAILCPNKHCFDQKCMEYQVVKHLSLAQSDIDICCPICYTAMELSVLSQNIRPEYLGLLKMKGNMDQNVASPQLEVICQMIGELKVELSAQAARHSRLVRITEAIKNEQKKDKELLNSLNEKLKRYGEALTELATGKKSPCPRLVVLEPIAQKKGVGLFLPRKYNLYFVCEHSFEKVDSPMTFSMSRKWIRQVAPFLLIAAQLLPLAIGIPIPPGLLNSIFSSITGFIDPDFASAVSNMVGNAMQNHTANMMVIPSHLDATARSQTWEDSARLLTKGKAMSPKHIEIADSAYKTLCEFARKEENMKLWKNKMSLVVNEHGHFIWVIKNYTPLYNDTHEP